MLRPAMSQILKPGESYNYYRDENDVHYVPKRPLEELIIK